MKPNLKSKPLNCPNCSNWFVEFEKELRAWRERIRRYPLTLQYDKGQISVIDQILGE